MAAGASTLVSYMGHSLVLPNWFVRQRGLAIGIAFSGVGVGSFLLLARIGARVDVRALVLDVLAAR